MNRAVDLIKKYDFPVMKKYGQNFLTDDNILKGIIEASGVTKEDVVLEIGPGTGALTSYLCGAAGLVIAVEIDRMLIPVLKETMAGCNNFVLVNGDILKVDIDGLVKSSVAEYAGKFSRNKENVMGCTEEHAAEANSPEEYIENKADAGNTADGQNGQFGKKIKVVANLPYYITTPVIMELLEKQENIESITVMVQKEVAARMKEGPGSKSYGALSLAVQYYSKPEIVMPVSRHCFFPKPDVDSAVIRLDIYDKDKRPVKADDTEKMFGIIRAAFNQRRKTLANALLNAGNPGFTKENVLEAISAIGKLETVRGEALTLKEFADFSNFIRL